LWIEQAKNVAKKFDWINFELVIVSELPRTKETASIIIWNSKSKFLIDSRINDRKTEFEDKLVSDFHKAVKDDIFNLKFINGESFIEEKNRVFDFLDNLKNYNYKNILVVAHDDTLKIINGYYKKLSNQQIRDTKIENCHVLEFEV